MPLKHIQIQKAIQAIRNALLIKNLLLGFFDSRHVHTTSAEYLLPNKAPSFALREDSPCNVICKKVAYFSRSRKGVAGEICPKDLWVWGAFWHHLLCGTRTGVRYSHILKKFLGRKKRKKRKDHKHDEIKKKIT
jgi:hypothetical protein